MKRPLRLSTIALFTTALSVGCSGDDSSSGSPEDVPAARGATATAEVVDLIELSNMSAANAMARGVFDPDDLDDLLGDFESGLDGAGCVSGVLVGNDTVAVSFDDCGLSGDTVSGSVNITVQDKLGAVAIAFDGHVNIGGCEYEGSWTLTIGTADISIAGDVTLSHAGIADAQIEFDANWSYAIFALCPSVDLTAIVVSAGESVTVEIDNLDLCTGVCGGGSTVSIVSGSDSVTFDPSSGDVSIGSGDDSVSIGCSGGDISIGDGDDDGADDDDGDDGDDDGDDNDDDNPTSVSPKTGTWDYNTYTPISNNCALAEQYDSDGAFGLDNHGNGTFTIYGDVDPFLCHLDGAAYDCPNMINESDTAPGATITVQGSAEGVFHSDESASGTRQITVDCSGDGCALAAQAAGHGFPCTFEVSYEVHYTSSL